MNNGATKSGPRTLQATLERSGDHIAVRWEIDEPEGEKWRRYSVSLRDVLRCADEVQEALDHLANADWADQSGAEVQPRLKSLAKAGSKLYNALMHGDPMARRSEETANKFRSWFEEAVLADTDNWRVQVVHHQYDAAMVPWGLTFSPIDDEEYEDLTLDWKDYKNFWAMSLNLSCRGVLRKEADRFTRIRDIDTTIALTVEAGEDVMEFHKKNLPDFDEDEIDGRLAKRVKDFEKISKEHELYNVFWYVFLNQAEGGYFLDDDELTISAIKKAKANIGKIFIMFLDGNAVIRGERGVKWVDTLLDKGRTGLIATEADVKNPQLTHVGWRFLKWIIRSEKPLIDAVHSARIKFWPKSLLYGVYCDPLRIYFNPAPEEEIKLADRFLKSIEKFRQQSD